MSKRPLHTEPTGSTPAAPLQSCYLIHFEQPYKSGRHPGARHYVGYSDDIDRRIETHRKGHGSPLVAAVLAVGIDFRRRADVARYGSPLLSASCTIDTAVVCAPSSNAVPSSAGGRSKSGCRSH
jgi:hypothetical protein